MHMSESALRAVLAARQSGELDQNRLWQLARIGADESVLPIVGPGIGIRIEGEYLGIALRRQLIVGVQPHQPQPLALWSRERLGGGIPQ